MIEKLFTVTGLEVRNPQVIRLVLEMAGEWNKPAFNLPDCEWTVSQIHPIYFRLANEQVPKESHRYLLWLLDRNYDKATESQQANWDEADFVRARSYIREVAQLNLFVHIL